MFASLRVPYTGLIILLGFIGGILFNIFSNDDTILTITATSPDLLVAIFLPALVFQSAYRTEYHAFMKSLYSILLLSIVGYFISLFSISVLNKYLFRFQQWTFLQCLILGIIVSTTRPVTLMRQAGLSFYFITYFFYNTNSIDYGKTKRLNIILEGESVINNSLAIILFNAMKIFVVNDQTWHSMI
jgi:NhaP-type Na+/H+ or K+/H+ antiporter